MNHPKVRGRCPSCGHGNSLFLGSGGYVTCSIAECKDPSAVSDMLLNLRERVGAQEEKEVEISVMTNAIAWVMFGDGVSPVITVTQEEKVVCRAAAERAYEHLQLYRMSG